jgi:4-carboxymuconolactone decarboxylase
MRLSKPRVPPLTLEECNHEQRELLTKGNPARILNVFATIARHSDLYRRWIPFGNHILFKSTLSPRDREIAILRIGHLCRSGYEFAQHTVVGKRAGLSDAEIERTKLGPEAQGWSESERLIVQATDELHHDSFISDSTWAGLVKHYNTNQIIDLVFTVGQYTMVSMALNSFGVQLEDDVKGPDLPVGSRSLSP